MPPVAVVVPSYNHARYLSRCLRSIFAQTHPPSQVLVIDDGSTDDSVAVAERVLADSPVPAELLARPNHGLAATLNEGLARTSGELFAYLGSDDVWHPDRLRAGAAALTAQPDASLAYGQCYVIDDDDQVVGCSRHQARHGDGEVVRRLLRLEFVPPSPTVTFRRAAVARVGWNEANRLEDYELYLQLAGSSSFAFVDRPLGYWRWHHANTTWQSAAILDEIQAAQARFAARHGVSRRVLRHYQACARFRFAYHFLLAGDRRTALVHSLRSLAGAGSLAAVLDRSVRLLLPLPVLGALRRFRARGATPLLTDAERRH